MVYTVTLSSKTSYCRDSQGKLSSKGLQKKANTDSLTYHLQSCLQGTWMAVSTAVSRPDPVGKCIPIGRGRTALSYVYLKRRVAEDGIHTEPLHLWAAHGLPAYLSAIWPPPAPPMLANMRRMTCDYSGLFACSSLAIPGVASPRWPLDYWHCPLRSWPGHSLASWSFTVICSRLTGNWPGKLLALGSCWTGLGTSLQQLTTEPGTLVIVHDMQATHSHLLSSWFTHGAHHYDTSIIHLVQNVFDKDPSHWTISLNATYIVLFKNSRDMSQVSHLDKQVNPGGMACWQSPITTSHPPWPTAMWWFTSNSQHPRNFAWVTLCFSMRTFRRHSPLRPEKRGHCRGGPPQGGYLLPRRGHNDCQSRLGLHSTGGARHGSQMPAHHSPAAAAGSKQHRSHHGHSYSQETTSSPCPPPSPGRDPLQPL